LLVTPSQSSLTITTTGQYRSVYLSRCSINHCEWGQLAYPTNPSNTNKFLG
jgi:hypothetical protein